MSTETKEAIDVEFKSVDATPPKEEMEIVEAPSDEVVEEMKGEPVMTEEQLAEQKAAYLKFQAEIDEAIEAKGYAYVHEGKLLDKDSVQVVSKEWAIINTETGTPFIFSGQVVRYPNRLQADAALLTLQMYTGKKGLLLMDASQLDGESIL